MPHFNYRQLSGADRKALLEDLVDTMEAAKTKKRLQNFFLQLVTPHEAVMLARRWQIAKLLAAGKSYYAINRELKAGMTTISSVDTWLSGAIGDYKEKVAKRMRARLRRLPVHAFPNTFPFVLLNLLVDASAYIWSQHELGKQEGVNPRKR